MELKKTADYLVMGAIAFNFKTLRKNFYEHNIGEVCPNHWRRLTNKRKRGFWEGENVKIR